MGAALQMATLPFDGLSSRIRDIVVETVQTVTAEAISEDSDLFALGLDSLNTVSLVLRLEEVFGVEFEMDDIDYRTFRTVAGISELIRRKTDA